MNADLSATIQVRRAPSLLLPRAGPSVDGPSRATVALPLPSWRAAGASRHGASRNAPPWMDRPPSTQPCCPRFKCASEREGFGGVRGGTEQSVASHQLPHTPSMAAAAERLQGLKE